MGPTAGAAVADRPRSRRNLDVGRRIRPEICPYRILERTAADLDPRRCRHGLRLSVRDPAGARATLAIAGGAGGQYRLYRARPRGTADHRIVHGRGDAA